MLECEIKLLDIDTNDILLTLTRIGARKHAEDLVLDIYLQSKKGKQIRSRIRCTENNTVLTYKFKLPVTKAKQAYEFDANLPYDFMIDSKIRPDIVDHVRIKKRTSYKRGGYIFDIDEYRGVPPILEIEGPDEGGIQKIILLLGREKYTQGVFGGKGVYAHYDVAQPEITIGFVGRLLSLIRCL